MAEKVKIQTVGPRKDIPNKKDANKPWKSYSLQFEGDPNWYDTFWLSDLEPVVGEMLEGEKKNDEKYGWKFDMGRQGGKSNWNPAAAQSTVMLAAVQIVNGFLTLPGHYELWDKGDVALKDKFAKYVASVEAASKVLKEKVVAMGSLQPEQKVAEKTSNNGDPGPTPPPDIEGWPEGEEPQDI